MADLLNAVLIGLLALLPLINPPTTVALFISLSKGLTREEKNKQARLAALYILIIMVLAYYVGEFIMSAFSISIPGLRMAGGGILIIMGFKMLFPAPPAPLLPNNEDKSKANFAFIPLAMPSTAGPGTIAMILSSVTTIKNNTLFPGWVLIAAPPIILILTSAIVWGCLRSSDIIMRIIGSSGVDAISRLMGFLLVCMGVQFLINGILEIVQMVINNNLSTLG